MVTVKEIREKEFSRMKHGYHEDEVDDFLDAIADQMEAVLRENRDLLTRAQNAEASLKAAEEALQNQAASAEPAVESVHVAEPQQAPAPVLDDNGYFRNLETTLRETLLSAQHIADKTIAEAKKKADLTVAQAEEQAQKLTGEANEKVLLGKLELETIKKSTAEYRDNFVEMVKAQLASLGVKPEDLLPKESV